MLRSYRSSYPHWVHWHRLRAIRLQSAIANTSVLLTARLSYRILVSLWSVKYKSCTRVAIDLSVYRNCSININIPFYAICFMSTHVTCTCSPHEQPKSKVILYLDGIIYRTQGCFPVMRFFLRTFALRLLNTRQWTNLRVLSTPYVYVGRKNAALEINLYIHFFCCFVWSWYRQTDKKKQL